MAQPTLTRLRTDYQQKLDAVKAFWDAIPEDVEPTAQQREQIKDLNKGIEELENRLKEATEFDGMRSAHSQKAAEWSTPVNRPGAFTVGDGRTDIVGPDGKPLAGSGSGARKSLGQMYVQSAEYQDFIKAIAPSGQIHDTMRIGNSPAFIANVKALITGGSDTSAGALVRTDYYNQIVPQPFRPLTLRDLITIGRTTSDIIEFMRVTGYTNNAAPVPEITATSGSGYTAGAKPESGVALEKATAPVRTIAHWIPVTKRALADAAQVETYINEFLEFGLEDVLEAQMLNGDGTGENFTGLFNTTGTGTQAWDTDMLTTTRKARTKVRIEGRANATAYLLHPTDWETLDLTQDGEERYYFGGPSALGNPRLWGLPVIENERVAVGTGAVGDFRQLILWDREQASIRMSDSHADFFTHNAVAILAELRAAFAVLRPAAIVEMDLTAA
jgi:HK97 family phage major capsid protein